MELVAEAQNGVWNWVAAVGGVFIVIGALWPLFVRSFAKFAETPQTGGWGPMSSETYKRASERNTKRARNEAAVMHRTVKFVCPGLMGIGLVLVIVAVTIG